MILGPYSNRGERIGARISVYEERERHIIKDTCVIDKEERENGPATILGLFLPRARRCFPLPSHLDYVLLPLMRLCSQRREPPHCLQPLVMWLCSQMLDLPHGLHLLLMRCMMTAAIALASPHPPRPHAPRSHMHIGPFVITTAPSL